MRKKLFAVIMSAMMMITFMPSMAFAAYNPSTDADKPVVGTNYDTVTYENKTYKTEKALVLSGSNWTGEVYVHVATAHGVQSPDSAFVSGWNVKYYPLTDAEPSMTTTSIPFDLKYAQFDAMEKTAFEAGFGTETKVGVSLKLYAPTDVTKTTADNGATINAITTGTPRYTKDNLTITNYDIKMDVPNYDFDKKYEKQDFNELKVSVLPQFGATAKVEGTVADKKMTFLAATPQIPTTTAGYLVDGKDYVSTGYAYDGQEHVLTQKEIPGVTSTFELWKDGKYEAVEKAAVTEVGTYHFRATAVKGSDKKTVEIEVKINQIAGTTKVGFAKNTLKADQYLYDVAKNYTAESVLKFVDFENSDSSAKKGIAANADLLKEYVKDFYVVTFEADKFDSSAVKATFEKDTEKLGKLTAAEKDALIAKYSVLYKNFKGTEPTRSTIANPMFDLIRSTGETAKLNITANGVEWTKCALTHTYKYKTLKKKSKTFTIKAKADTKVTYSLAKGGSKIKINKKTGKVTVKKGLKKGTYNIVVYAKAASNAYAEAPIKIKVK